MNLTELLIELDAVNKRLDRIENDPDYIKEKAAAIFKGKSYGPDPEAIKAILNDYL